MPPQQQQKQPDAPIKIQIGIPPLIQFAVLIVAVAFFAYVFIR